MAILKKEENPKKKMEIDLTGPDGNAFVLIATAKRLSRQLGLDGEMIAEEMMLGDYENLVEVFDKYFGDYVDLYR